MMAGIRPLRTETLAERAVARAGSLLRLVDRACAAAYVGFTFYVAWQLFERSLETSPLLFVVIVPVVISGVLLFPSLFRMPDLGLRLFWPLSGGAWGRRVRRIRRSKGSAEGARSLPG